jgi:hypothetical protein
MSQESLIKLVGWGGVAMAGLTKELKKRVRRRRPSKCAQEGCNETVEKGGKVRIKVHVPQDPSMPKLSAYCEKHRREKIRMILEVGDIGAQKGSGLTWRMLRFLMTPDTDRYHHFVVWRPFKDGDWLILESIDKGIAFSKLSSYNKEDIKFYRVKCDEAIRREAPDTLLAYGKSKYDNVLKATLFFQLLRILGKMIFCERKLRKIKARDVHYRADDNFICTEAVQRAYCLAGFHIVPDDILPVPASFKESGKLQLILEITRL